MTAEYIPEVKHLKLTFDDGSTETYHNVGPFAAAACIHSDNVGAHYERYIKNVYITIGRAERARNAGRNTD